MRLCQFCEVPLELSNKDHYDYKCNQHSNVEVYFDFDQNGLMDKVLNIEFRFYHATFESFIYCTWHRNKDKCSFNNLFICDGAAPLFNFENVYNLTPENIASKLSILLLFS